MMFDGFLTSRLPFGGDSLQRSGAEGGVQSDEAPCSPSLDVNRNSFFLEESHCRGWSETLQGAAYELGSAASAVRSRQRFLFHHNSSDLTQGCVCKDASRAAALADVVKTKPDRKQFELTRFNIL
jgi:hypothetical protein